MKRREFFGLLGGAAVWPVAARGQQRGKLPLIGFLGANTASSQRGRTDAFIQRLHELGWVEGRDVSIEYRWVEGRFERSAGLLAELIGLHPDIIVTHATQNVLAAKHATATIPIVFAAAGDPVGTGVVASLSRPGENVTGLSLQSNDLAGKRLEILRELAPTVRQVNFIASAANPNTQTEMHELEAAGHALGLDVVSTVIRSADDLPTIIEGLKGQAVALYAQTDPLLSTHRARINTLAVSARVPAFAGFREFVEVGGLMSYGPNFPDMFRRAGEYVDKILRGAKPGDIPVEQPTKFDLVLNLTTARALGLTVPPTLFATADDLIE